MATPANTFAKVRQPDAGAVTVSLAGDMDAPFGSVLGPHPASGGAGIALGQDGSLPAHQALAIACHLANEIGRAVVVVDPHGRWRPAWGRLESA